MEIKPGKYTLRNGVKCEVLHVDTEHRMTLPVSALYLHSDGTWRRFNVKLDGRLGELLQSDFDIVAEGWPVEFVVGRWYRTPLGFEVQLVADAPKWASDKQRIYSSLACRAFTLSDSQIVAEIETPDFAKPDVQKVTP